MEIKLKFEKETKNTYRYREVDEQDAFKEAAESVLYTLYIRKAALPSKPAAIVVTVEAAP